MNEPANDILAAAFGIAKGNKRAARALHANYPQAEWEIGAALATENVLSRVIQSGWLPEDLQRAATRRNVDEFAHSYLLDAIAGYVGKFAPETIHPLWQRQLAQIEASVWWSGSRTHLEQWSAKHLLISREAVETVVETLGFLMTLHPLELLVALPGAARPASTARPHGVDAKVLGRIRGLLAKAESSSFPEEAEALSAKAQQLMTRHALDQVLVESPTPSTELTQRRLWLDTPYLDAKSLLVGEVAGANMCRSLFTPEWGFVSVLGEESDVESVELLTTSLLVQATRAMIASGDRATRGAESRSRGYRKSFLMAYAIRIGERLAKASEEIITEAPEHDKLLPVLASRQKHLDAAFAQTFPNAVGRSMSIPSGRGWGAGKAAADRAVLTHRTAVPER